MTKSMNICVFCSANDLEAKYTAPAKEFARLLAKNGHALVWGGSDYGMMNLVASAVQKNGGKITGISVEFFKEKARKNADEMVIAKDLGERKATMLVRSDAVVMMVGGIGTLDEATEIIALKKIGKHNKPIVVLNTDNFYEGLKIQLERMEKEGMLPPVSKLAYFADTPQPAIDYLNSMLSQTK